MNINWPISKSITYQNVINTNELLNHKNLYTLTMIVKAALCEKCPNTEFFLVRIWTLFTQCSYSGVFLTQPQPHSTHTETSQMISIASYYVNGILTGNVLSYLFLRGNGILWSYRAYRKSGSRDLGPLKWVLRPRTPKS